MTSNTLGFESELLLTQEPIARGAASPPPCAVPVKDGEMASAGEG